jgi:hypothetical protein
VKLSENSRRLSSSDSFSGSQQPEAFLLDVQLLLVGKRTFQPFLYVHALCRCKNRAQFV